MGARPPTRMRGTYRCSTVSGRQAAPWRRMMDVSGVETGEPGLCPGPDQAGKRDSVLKTSLLTEKIILSSEIKLGPSPSAKTEMTVHVFCGR